ncbi:MCE family protein [Planotetraspora sp. A-T 1434]|uniref:MCE family protein n=1 Tax=Planotetraspora sp. A-T 1434 TaxID=2979219 RepID=UPI0021BE70BF|nr:MCE family protein [Planotetraspora sp. A-T 1434]MCT9930490.1 MCE family protein [Planotetraspora sp. A-T 1434]
MRRRALGWFAVFALVTAGLLGLIGARIARLQTGPVYRLVAVFDDVSGLREGDQVKIAGAPVGQVETIKVLDGRAEVTMAVERAVRVPSDSEAAVRWRDAIGQRVVYLLPGTATGHLTDGARITHTASVVDIGRLVQDLGPLTRSLDPGQINRLLTAAGQALDGNERNIPRLVAGLDDVTATIVERKKVIERMLGDYATVTGVVARRDRQIGRLVRNLVTLSDAFAANQKAVDDALVELSATVHTSDLVLGSNAEQLGTVIDHLGGLTGGLRRHVADIRSAMTRLQPLLARAYATTSRGRFVTTAVPCVALGPPPCPYGMSTPPPLRGSARLTGAGLRALMVGE